MTRNAVFHEGGSFDDGSPITSFPGAVSSVFGRTGTVAAAAGDYYGAVPAALTGATQASRFAGATVSGAPVSGTFAVGDHVLSLADGKWYVCTVAGTPGTWVTPASGTGVTYGTPAVVLGTAAAAGSTDEAIRRDSTIVAFDTTAPSTQAFGDAAATGSAAVAARRDHVHGMPAAPTAYIGYVLLQDQKSAGTAGGASTSGSFQTRTLNTEVVDTAGDCSLSANQFTLTAGVYDIQAHAPAFVSNQHQIRLRNITDGATILSGTGEYNDTSVANQTRSFLAGRFTIGASKALELQHRVASSRTGNGYGVAGNFGETEVYAVVELWRVS